MEDFQNRDICRPRKQHDGMGEMEDAKNMASDGRSKFSEVDGL